MTAHASIDFAAIMPAAALRLLGEPNPALSKGDELRWGAKGSLSIDKAKGTYFDHEAKAGGGLIDLIRHERGGEVADAMAWLEAEGLKDASPPARTAWQLAGARSTFHDYADASGVVRYRVERRGKGAVPPFRQWGPDVRGGFHSAKGCMSGVEPLLYRLPEIVTAEPSRVVFVVEGEKDADRLAGLGLLATTNSGGAGKFPASRAVDLTGRKVVVIGDNDDAGRAHVADVLAKLRPVATTITALPLPGLAEKGDVSDWLDAGGTVDQLKGLASAALAAPIDVVAPEPDLLQLLDPAAWAGTETPHREWAWHGMMPARQMTYLTGGGGSGKSLFGQQLATSTALGRAFLGLDTTQGVTLYLTCEDDPDELHRRQKAICDTMGVSLAALAGKLHLASLAGAIGNELATFDPLGRMAAGPAYQRLRATVLAIGAKLIVLDNVAHLFAGNENIRNQVAAFCGLLNGLAAEAGAAVLLIGHPNKAGADFSGSTAWENQVRSRLFLDRPREADGTVLDPDARVLTRAKANYARHGEELTFRWHQWAFVREDDLPASVGAELSAVVQANAENDRFLKCLAKATEERRATSPNRTASNYAPRMFAAMTMGKGIGERGFEAALERLLHLGMIRNGERVYQRDNRAWVTGLGLAPTLAPTMHEPFAPTCTEAPPHEGESCTNLHALTPLDTTYLSGAASGADAPSSWHSNAALGRQRSGPILAPGESADDPVPEFGA